MAAVLHAQRAYRFPNTAQSVGLARRAVRDTLRAWRLSHEVIEPALVITSELAANSVMHAATSPTFEVGCLLHLGRIILAVADQDPRPPVRRHPADDADHGRGLLLIEALAEHWGYAPGDIGKTVFARLRVAEPPSHVYLPPGNAVIQNTSQPGQGSWLAVIESLAHHTDSCGNQDHRTTTPEPSRPR